MSDEQRDVELRRRIVAAAILAGHGGLRGLADAMGARRLSYGSLRSITTETLDLESKLEDISRHCSEAGVSVPLWWLLGGFEGDATTDRPAMMSDLWELEARLTDR